LASASQLEADNGEDLLVVGDAQEKCWLFIVSLHAFFM
jgi:hypothetical protein